MATEKSSAPHAHPSTEDDDDAVEAHYSCLECPCACMDGWVFVGYIDEYGEEREASYRCRRCADSPKPPLPQGLGRAPNTQRYGRSLSGYPDRLGPGLDQEILNPDYALRQFG